MAFEQSPAERPLAPEEKEEESKHFEIEPLEEIQEHAKKGGAFSMDLDRWNWGAGTPETPSPGGMPDKLGFEAIGDKDESEIYKDSEGRYWRGKVKKGLGLGTENYNMEPISKEEAKKLVGEEIEE